MYYRSVNRGISFTKPGLYAFGLVLAVGMIAVATGMNGLYLFLSAGLGGFIISGLLSEKAMKSCRVRTVAATVVDAGAPFTVTFTIENDSRWFTVFALQSFFMLEQPRFRLISHKPDAFAAVKIGRVPPASQHAYTAQCAQMPRGFYREVLALQQTTFPFGILEKFKLVEIPASLIVAPRLDPAYLDDARQLLRQRLAALDADKEFFTHRAYLARDALKHVDWRKSAGRPQREWVVKQYRSPAGVAPIRLLVDWGMARAFTAEAAYEDWLVRARAALKALDETGRGYVLDFGDARVVSGLQECLAALAAVPSYEGRAAGPGVPVGGAPQAATLAVVVLPSGLEWRDARRRARA